MAPEEAQARARDIVDWLDANPGLSRALAARGIEIELKNVWKEAMNYRLDDADLALIEINRPTPLVLNLVEEIRRLRDENASLSVQGEEIDRLNGELATAKDEIDYLNSEINRAR